MLSNLTVSTQAVLPMFIIIGIGMLIRKVGIINETDVVHMNKAVFISFMPILIFSNIYGKSLYDILDVRLLLFIVIGQAMEYILALALAFSVEKDNRARGAIVQGMSRSNFITMGSAILLNLFGSEGMMYMPVLLVGAIPVSNLLVTIILEFFRGEKPDIKKIVIKVLKNPLIIASVVGVLTIITGLDLPVVVENAVKNIAGAATPMVLFLLGASFNPKSIRECKRNLAMMLFVRLVVFPALGVFFAVEFGFTGVALVSLLLLFGSPTAAVSFTMAQEMDSDADLTSNAIIFGSLLSCISLFFWIFLLKSLNLF